MRLYIVMLVALLAFSLPGRAAEEPGVLIGPQPNVSRLLQFSKETGDTEGDILAYNSALTAFNAAVRANNLEAAIEPGLRALELGEKLSAVSAEDRGKIAISLGRIFVIRRKGEEATFAMYDRTLGHFDVAYGANSRKHFVPLLEVAKYSIKKANVRRAEGTLLVLGAVKDKNFDYPCVERAQYHLYEVAVIRLQIVHGNPRGYRNSHGKKARSAYKKARSDFLAIGNFVGVGDVLFDSGKFEMESRKYSAAIPLFLEALKSYEKGGLPEGDERVLRCHTFIAQLYLKRGKDREATPHLQHVARHQGDVDRENVQPLYRVPPMYPRRAYERGIEGWVFVEFTISKEGAVKEPVVLDSEPKGQFEKAALKAVRKWRYVPVAQGGVIIEAKTRVVLTFELE